MDTAGRILVTGATGYIGGRLVPRLLQEGYRVRVLTRSQRRIGSRAWSDEVEVAAGDALDAPSLSTALTGVECAYYLIHSMARGTGFHELDIEAARLFGRAARQAGVRRIVYVGGLGDPRADLSQHLRSRQETGHALRESGVPVTEFRAAVIVGSGSISFELIRYLVERLPIMICPRWVYSRVQPIAVADLLDYLVAALTNAECEDKVIQVGGRDVTTYKGMMLGYAAARGLTRWLLPVPVLTPRLSSYWVHWVTPIPAKVSGPLIEGLRNEVVVTDSLARSLFPHIQPQDYATALARVVAELDAGQIETAWSDAHSPSPAQDDPIRLESQQGMILERRRRQVAAPASAVYRVLTGIGGQRGWYYANWAWRIRGIVDRLLGGVGLRRGRRHPDELRVGDALDFWRVEALEADHLVRLRAEMKLPGRAWLQFEVRDTEAGTSQLEQTAAFLPKGLGGLAYWYGLYPVHARIFDGLAREIARRSCAAEARLDTQRSLLSP